MSTTQARTPVVVRTTPRLRHEDGIRYGIAHAGLVAAAMFAGAARLPAPLSLAVVAGTAFLGARSLAVHWRIGIALAGWAIWTGFLHHTLGQLTFSDADLLRLVGLLVLVGACAPLGRRRWDRLGP